MSETSTMTTAPKKTKRGYTRPRVEIQVLQRHIDQSMQKNSSHCMIAEAIKETLPNAKFVSVDLQTIRWTDPQKGLRYVVLTPKLAQLQLIAFDQGDLDNLQPFEFEMRPRQVTKAGNRFRGHAPDDPIPPDDAKAVNDGAVVQPVEGMQAAPVKAGFGAAQTEHGEAKTVNDKPVEAAAAAHKPRRTRVMRQRLDKPETPGSIPVKLGGRTPPFSILHRREFGVCVLRR